MTLTCKTATHSYDIVLQRGALDEAGEYFSLDRRVCIVTDDGVPPIYAQRIAAQCWDPLLITVPQGEASKSLETMGMLCTRMMDAGFSRRDCVVAVGGGVVGDLAGFAAATYMRGIDFYNVPTTLLAQVDSSVGGKTAVNLAGVKNIVGAFWPPRAVLIDPDVLLTLSPRQFSNGLAEAIKMSVTSDPELFALLENENAADHIDTIIERSLRIKRSVVEQDEKESGLRQILNFGHTIGHGIEASGGMSAYLHGECVALGMLPMCSDTVRTRLLAVLRKNGLPTAVSYDREAVWEAMRHDKKFSADTATVVLVEKIGHATLKRLPAEQLKSLIGSNGDNV